MDPNPLSIFCTGIGGVVAHPPFPHIATMNSDDENRATSPTSNSPRPDQPPQVPKQSPQIAQDPERSAVPFILPLIVFMILSMLAPSFETVPEKNDGSKAIAVDQQSADARYTAERNNQKARNYTLLIIAQVAVGFGLLFWFRNDYLHSFPLSISFWSVLVGIVGCLFWVAIAKLGLEHNLLSLVGLEDWLPKRVGFDPNQIGSSQQRTVFIGFRFLVLAALVPVIEELFLRGWLIRYIDNERWWTVGLGSLSLKACAAATLYGVATHPGEIFAAIIWFSMVTWMMKMTNRFWDCVVAHAVTNLLLGIWVMQSGDWFLW